MVTGEFIKNGVCCGTTILLYDKNNFFLNKKNPKNNINNEIFFFIHNYKKIIYQLKKNILNTNIFLNKKYYKPIYIKKILIILNNKKIFNKILFLIKKQNNSLKSALLVLYKEILKYKKNKDYKENVDYISIKYTGNILFNYLVKNKKLFLLNNNNLDLIIVVKNISLIYLIDFIFLNVLGIIIESKNKKIFNNKNLRLFSCLIMYMVSNITKIINNGNFIIIDSTNNNIIINPKSINIKKYLRYIK